MMDILPFKNRDGVLQQAGAIMAHERGVTRVAMRRLGWKEPEALVFLAVQEALDTLVKKNPGMEIKTQTVLDVTNLFFDEMSRVRAAHEKAGITPADVGGA